MLCSWNGRGSSFLQPISNNLYVLCPVQIAKVNKVERVEHNPVELLVEVPRPVVIEKTIEAPCTDSLEKRMCWYLSHLK